MASVRQSQYSQIAVKALNADSASYAVTASHALNSGGSPITIKDEGSTLTTAVTSIDFVGAGVTSTSTGSIVTVTIPGGGGSIDTGSFITTASLSSSILIFEKGDNTTFNIPFNDFDFSLNFISAVSYSIILPYSYSIDTIDNPGALTVTISSSGAGYTTGSVINPFATTVVEVGTYGYINLNCIKLE